MEAVASRLLLSDPHRRSPVAAACERLVNRDVIDETHAGLRARVSQRQPEPAHGSIIHFDPEYQLTWSGELQEEVPRCRGDPSPRLPRGSCSRTQRSLDVRIAIIDFGTGYSSLAHLARFLVDFGKIDRSFVDGVCTGRSEAALVRGVLCIAEELQLISIAEGVEDAVHDLELRRLHCTHAQGYYYSRPAPAPDFAELLTHGNSAIRGAA